ncbi:MAG TPA: PsiF family protein [Steroidobacteraceae bacterium]|nr:PsiF family protein [Steroidobacteraceae bacterium]
MKGSTGWVALAAALGFLALQAPPALATNSQQDKMSTCNADATSKGLKGDERKAYMKSCLSDAPAPAAKGNSQQEKMKSCNATATTKGLKGDERKAFMSTCLSGSSTAH